MRENFARELKAKQHEENKAKPRQKTEGLAQNRKKRPTNKPCQAADGEPGAFGPLFMWSGPEDIDGWCENDNDFPGTCHFKKRPQSLPNEPGHLFKAPEWL